MAQLDFYDTQVAAVTRFMVVTTKAIMAKTVGVPDADGTEVVPLDFVREAVIEDQHFQDKHYFLELQKEPGSLWLKELTVSWVPEKDADPPADVFRTVVTNTVEQESLVELGGRGFYQVFFETSEDLEYFVKLHISRL